MRATLCWAAPAVLFACAVGCGRDSSPAHKGPGAEPPKANSSPLAGGKLVTLKVEGMV